MSSSTCDLHAGGVQSLWLTSLISVSGASAGQLATCVQARLWKNCSICLQVCMLTCCPQLLRHFVYQDDSAGLLDHLCSASVMIKRMLGRDLIIAEAFCRNFWWHTLMLWPNELPPVTVVCLSYDDNLVPCELVQKQLKEKMQPQAKGSGRKLDVILNKGPHGAFLAKPEIQDRMLTSLRDGIQHSYRESYV
jgi:hypothetical protein